MYHTLTSSLTSARALCHRFTNRFKGDNRGVAAVEFALIAPVLIFMYFGLAETASLIDVDRNVSHTASVVGDLTTQNNAITANQMADIMAAGIMVMGVDDATELSNLSIEITSFMVNSNGDAPTRIGYARLGNPIPSNDEDGNSIDNYDGSDMKGKGKLISTNSGIVVARVSYSYQSPTTKFVGNPTLDETFKLKPRKTPTIAFTGGSGSGDTYSCTASLTSNSPSVSCS